MLEGGISVVDIRLILGGDGDHGVLLGGVGG
jgi:hypothetical protein